MPSRMVSARGLSSLPSWSYHTLGSYREQKRRMISSDVCAAVQECRIVPLRWNRRYIFTLDPFIGTVCTGHVQYKESGSNLGALLLVDESFKYGYWLYVSIPTNSYAGIISPVSGTVICAESPAHSISVCSPGFRLMCMVARRAFALPAGCDNRTGNT